MADVTARERLRLLAVREYVPFLGVAATWALVAAAVGHADAVRLLAASAFVRSMRYLTAPDSRTGLRRRAGGKKSVHRRSLRTALVVELIALCVGLAGLAALVSLLSRTGHLDIASLCGALSVGLPALYLLPIATSGQFTVPHRLLSAWVGAALMALAWWLEASPETFALAFAARDWVALSLAVLMRRRKPAGEVAADHEPLVWQEIAGSSLARGRRQLNYRLSKSLLKVVLGPFGGFAARTGRGLRLDRKLEAVSPKRPLTLAVMFLVPVAASLALLAATREPGLVLLSATLLRAGTSAGNVLIWWSLGRSSELVVEADDDDDD